MYLPGLDLPPPSEPAGDNWFTPQWVLDWIGPIALDPCYCASSLVWAAATLDLRRGDDGLTASWGAVLRDAGEPAGVVFVNPPFSNTSAWLAKCAVEAKRLRRAVVALVPAIPGDGPWHAHVWPHRPIVGYIAGRVEFVGLDGVIESKGRGHALVVYGPTSEAMAYVDVIAARAAQHPQRPVWTVAV